MARWWPRAAHAVECAQVTLPGGGDALRWWASDDDDDDQGDGDDGEAGAGERRAASGSRAVAEDADAAGGIPIPTARRHSRSIDVGQPGNTPVKVWELQLTPNSERARCATRTQPPPPQWCCVGWDHSPCDACVRHELEGRQNQFKKMMGAGGRGSQTGTPPPPPPPPRLRRTAARLTTPVSGRRTSPPGEERGRSSR
eukprot:COSAG01_NODE_730_length_14022_cov_127.417511_4_plen_198_part_00